MRTLQFTYSDRCASPFSERPSITYSSLYSVVPPRQAMPKAKTAARRALRIDATIAEAHTSLALTHPYYDWDWAAAETGFQRALELNPNYATAHHWYHEYLTAMGRFDEQMSEILHAEELDPLSLIINTDVGWGLYYAENMMKRLSNYAARSN